MGPLSVSTHRGLVHWQGLLLVVSLLTFWCPPTNAHFTVVSKNVAEGKDVRLRLRDKPPNVIGFRWFKGPRELPYNKIGGYFMLEGKFETGHLYAGRREVDLDGSLLIRKATSKDRGIYTTVAYLANSAKVIGFGQLKVYRPVGEPTLLSNNNTIGESKDGVGFTCHTHADCIKWLFNGMDLHLSERMKLSQNHRSLTIDPVQREDEGYYQCKVSNLVSSAESWAILLRVHHH